MWFQRKGQGQIQGQMQKIVKNGKLRFYLLLFYQSLQKWEEVLYTKVNYNVRV